MLIEQNSLYQQITENDYQLMAGPDWPTYQEFASGVPLEQSIADEINVMLRTTEKKQKSISNFCVMPFYAREYIHQRPSNLIHCGWLSANYDIKSLQQDMLANRRSPFCNKCWQIEDAGHVSNRQINNATLDYIGDIDLLHLFDQAKLDNHTTTHYKISAGNFCNATCTTCDDNDSTAWGNLLKSSKNVKPLTILKQKGNQISVDYESAQFINFTGGESTMIRTHWDIIESLRQAKNFNCIISFTTNGSFNINQRQMELLSHFKNVNFNFSIDGVGPVFEYLRYPLSWNKLIDNVAWAAQQGFIVSSICTISNLNIMYHDRTVSWLTKNNIRYLENPVRTPVHFAPKSLSRAIKKQISMLTNSALIHSMLGQHSTVDDINYQKFLNQIQFQDQLKNIRIQDYLPEFWALTQSA